MSNWAQNDPGNQFLSGLFGPPQNQPSSYVEGLEVPDMSELEDEREGVTTAIRGDIDRQHEADLANMETARNFGDDVVQRRDEASQRFDDLSGRIDENREELQGRIDQTRLDLEQVPGQVRSEFEGLREDFDSRFSEALGRHDERLDAALADVERGRSLAMEAAVQGTQGEVAQALAQIDADPNLTQAQKRQMKNQVQLSGASSLAATVGATQADFTQAAASVHNSFGQAFASIEGAGLSGAAQLSTAQGTTMAQTRVAMAGLASDLLSLEATSDQAWAQSQIQVQAERSAVEMAGDELLLNLLPHMEVPSPQYAPAAIAEFEMSRDAIMSQFEMDAMGTYLDLQRALADETQGTFFEKILDFGLALAG